MQQSSPVCHAFLHSSLHCATNVSFDKFNEQRNVDDNSTQLLERLVKAGDVDPLVARYWATQRWAAGGCLDEQIAGMKL
jgi:hypothetical protein